MRGRTEVLLDALTRMAALERDLLAMDPRTTTSAKLRDQLVEGQRVARALVKQLREALLEEAP